MLHPLRTLTLTLSLAAALGCGSPAETAAPGDAPALKASPVPFADVVGHWAEPAIEALRVDGLVSGYADGSFRPDAPASRAQVAAMLAGNFDLRATGAAKGFSDVDGHWASDAIAQIAAAGVMRGDPDGRFRPDDPMTRAELFVALTAALGVQPLGPEAPGDTCAQPALGGFEDVDAVPRWACAGLAAAVGNDLMVGWGHPGALKSTAVATRAEATAAMHRGRVLMGKADSVEMQGLITADHAASLNARYSVEFKTTLHQVLRSQTGFGTHYGDGSAFHLLDDSEQRAYVEANKVPGTQPLDPAEMTVTSCIQWTMEHLDAWHAARGLDGRWAEIEDRLLSPSDPSLRLRGTDLAAELEKDGWTVVYVNADSSYVGATGPDNDHIWSLRVAEREGTYFGVPVDDIVTDWARDPAKLARLDDLPFFVYVANGGYHVTAGVDGRISEVDRSQGPTRQVIYGDDRMVDMIDTYLSTVYTDSTPDEARQSTFKLWGSGMLLVPPGQWR